MAWSGEKVNPVAHQASDQGRSEGVVSRLEVQCSCGIGTSFGLITEQFLWTDRGQRSWVAGGRTVKYFQLSGKTVFSAKMGSFEPKWWLMGDASLPAGDLKIRWRTDHNPRNLKLASASHNPGLTDLGRNHMDQGGRESCALGGQRSSS